MGKLHLIKLCVGVKSLSDLEAHRDPRAPEHVHITRMWPKREAELRTGGSLYWVIAGEIQARQQILELREVTAPDGTRRCAIVMAPKLILTTPAPRRPFQGWRYLKAEDAPADLLLDTVQDESVSLELSRELAAIGVV